MEIDPEKDRLDEKRESFEREREAENRAELAHQAGPQQAHLEGKNGSGDGTDREEHTGNLRPGAGEPSGVGIPVDSAPLSDQDQCWKSDAKAGEDDVPAERQAHLGARRSEVGGGVSKQAHD